MGYKLPCPCSLWIELNYVPVIFGSFNLCRVLPASDVHGREDTYKIIFWTDDKMFRGLAMHLVGRVGEASSV